MTITVYTKPDCQPCKATLRTFDRLGTPIVILPAADHVDELKALGYQSAPVVTITSILPDGTTYTHDHWYGFNPDKIDEWAA